MEDHAVTELRKVFPKITNSLGDAIWCVLTGEYPDGTYRNIILPKGDLIQGTWRFWSQIILDASGKKGDYMKFYMAHAPAPKIRSIERKLKKAGWKLSEEKIELDRNEKLRDETVAIMSEGVKKPKIEEAKKMLKKTVGILKPKKRGRPLKVK